MKIVEKGEMIGVRGFFLDEYSQFSAKSTSISQVAVCDRQDYLDCLNDFPEDFEKFCYFRD